MRSSRNLFLAAALAFAADAVKVEMMTAQEQPPLAAYEAFSDPNARCTEVHTHPSPQASRDACEEMAVTLGHAYYTWSESKKFCFTGLTCGDLETSTAGWDWQVYKNNAAQPPPAPPAASLAFSQQLSGAREEVATFEFPPLSADERTDMDKCAKAVNSVHATVKANYDKLMETCDFSLNNRDFPLPLFVWCRPRGADPTKTRKEQWVEHCGIPSPPNSYERIKICAEYHILACDDTTKYGVYEEDPTKTAAENKAGRDAFYDGKCAGIGYDTATVKAACEAEGCVITTLKGMPESDLTSYPFELCTDAGMQAEVAQWEGKKCKNPTAEEPAMVWPQVTFNGLGAPNQAKCSAVAGPSKCPEMIAEGIGSAGIEAGEAEYAACKRIAAANGLTGDDVNHCMAWIINRLEAWVAIPYQEDVYGTVSDGFIYTGDRPLKDEWFDGATYTGRIVEALNPPGTERKVVRCMNSAEMVIFGVLMDCHEGSDKDWNDWSFLATWMQSRTKYTGSLTYCEKVVSAILEKYGIDLSWLPAILQAIAQPIVTALMTVVDVTAAAVGLDDELQSLFVRF